MLRRYSNVCLCMIKIHCYHTTSTWGRKQTIHHLVCLLWCHNVLFYCTLHYGYCSIALCSNQKVQCLPEVHIPHICNSFTDLKEGFSLFKPYIQIPNHPELFLVHPTNMLFQKNRQRKSVQSHIQYMGLTTVLYLLTDVTLSCPVHTTENKINHF